VCCDVSTRDDDDDDDDDESRQKTNIDEEAVVVQVDEVVLDVIQMAKLALDGETTYI
jgi:hypothetical protein